MYIYTRMSVRNFVYSKDLEGSCGQYSVANCRCDVSAFDLRKSMWRLSKIDVATFDRLSKIDDRWLTTERAWIVTYAIYSNSTTWSHTCHAT